MLEDEPGYYLAFPEVPGQTLEEYLMLNPSLQESELQRLMREVEAALHDLHAAGFYHLFLCPRNIFYSPGRPLYIKDPSLTYPLYSFLLQELHGFDYSYFSPRLMDGGEGRPEEDFYSLGRIVREILEKVDWVGNEDARQAVAKRAGVLMADDDAGTELDEGLRLEVSFAQNIPESVASPVAEDAEEGEQAFQEKSRSRDPFEALRAKLEDQSMDAGEGRHWDARGVPGSRKVKRHLLGAMFVLAALCAVLLLLYGLPAMSESEDPQQGPERKVVLSEEAGETGAETAVEESEAVPDVLAGGSTLPDTSNNPDDKEQTTIRGRTALPSGQQHRRGTCRRGGRACCQPATGGVLLGFAVRGEFSPPGLSLTPERATIRTGASSPMPGAAGGAGCPFTGCSRATSSRRG